MRWKLDGWYFNDGGQFNRRKVLISAGSSRSQCEETKKTEYMRVKTEYMREKPEYMR